MLIAAFVFGLLTIGGAGMLFERPRGRRLRPRATHIDLALIGPVVEPDPPEARVRVLTGPARPSRTKPPRAPQNKPTAPKHTDLLDERAWDGPVVVEVSYASVDGAIPALLQAVTTALREYPLLNAAVGANGLTVFNHVDPAVTISAPTPPTAETAARTGTIAITLVGTPGIVLSQPLPKPPLVASMSVCQPAKAVIVDQESGGMAIRARGTIALTWNAAAADSAYAIAFLNRVAQLTA